MAGVPGKNKIETGYRLIVNTKDLSEDLVPGSIDGGGGLSHDQVDMRGVSDSVMPVMAGHGTAPLSAKFFMNDTATTGAFTVLKALVLNTAYTITSQFGSNGAAPSTGDPEWEGTFIFLGMKAGMEGGKAVVTANFGPADGQTPPAWGTVA